jgi:cytochrome c oxidase assembly factor CtaG
VELAAPSSFSADPILIGVAVASAAAVGWLLWRGREGPRTKRRRKVALGLALVLLVAVWFSPVAVIAQHYLLSAHLLQITILMGAIPPLLLLALPRVPVAHPPRAIRVVLRFLVHPLVAIIAVNAAFFGWHTSGAYSAAMQNDSLYALEQASLLLTSLAFWWPIITPFSPPVRSMTPLGKVGYIVLATIPQTFGGLVVALAHHSLYPAYATAPRLLGLDVMTDQQIAGASIAIVSKVALFAAFIVIFVHALDSVADAEDGGSGDGGIHPVIEPQPLPSGTPRWLLDVARGRTVREPRARRPRPVRAPVGPGSRRD